MDTIPRCDLARPPVQIARANNWGQAYRLTDTGCPAYDGSADSLLSIFGWMGVERGLRWKPQGGTTFCNVYATDVANACGVFLPRLWWVPAAIKSFQGGIPVGAVIGKTAIELSANALYRWLAGPYSDDFGWRRAADLEEAQAAANNGRPVVICARKTNEAHAGHIAVIAPESDRCRARRAPDGTIIAPVQSQAGATNREISNVGPWWTGTGSGMAEWGAWINDSAQTATLPEPVEPAHDAPEFSWKAVDADNDPEFLKNFLDSLADKNAV